MKIIRLEVKNFRGIRSVTLSAHSDINVIVGPNAIGKSTLLEAIRLAKVMLAPRMNNEAQLALIQMGALSQHNQALGAPGVDIFALANNPAHPIVVSMEVRFSSEEVQILQKEPHNLALMMLHSETIREASESPLAFTQFLSTSSGRAALATKTGDAASRLSALSITPSCTLELTMNHSTRTISGKDSFGQSLITVLDRRLPIHKTMISLFPADRAFPTGDQSIQVGAGDAAQQLQAHMALPASKYSRLKQTIIHNIMLTDNGKNIITDEFNLIFDSLLPGKKLIGIHINPLGLLKILVSDTETMKIFDIDQMSSGEKGLVLTFLFLRLSMQNGGIVLIDEPELHLNAAVQENLLSFIRTHCANALSLQVFVCTHSPEIVKDAFNEEHCGLFHLRSGDDLTPVLRQDQRELFEVFERLGSSPADVLFSRGNIYVEGEHDAQVLQAGFPGALSGFKISGLGGRGEIEREFPNLLAEEKTGRLKKVQLFILDNDRVVTSLKPGNLVRVHQHERYCLENYLLNADILYDLVVAHATKSVESRGKFPDALKDIALRQTAELAMREVYAQMSPASPGMRSEDCRDKVFAEVAAILSVRLAEIKAVLEPFDKGTWETEFTDRSSRRKAEIDAEWQSKWQTVCSGKKIIDDLYVRYQITMKKVEFKKEIVRKMAEKSTDEWRVLNDVLVTGLK